MTAETSLRVVFMGTPTFAVPTLRGLIEAAIYDIVAVVTQPDAPAGRGRELAMSPVKRLALEHGLNVLQPARMRQPEVDALRALRPDVCVVAAFGQILRRSVLEIPPLGCLNVHASLLPRWRGAAPIPAAILAGDAETGITIMRMDEGMDTGDILVQEATPIFPDDTGASLTSRLAEMGARLLLDTLPRWARGEILPRPQDETQATYCKPIHKEAGRLDWTQPADLLARAVRAYQPWPAAYSFWGGKLLKIIAASALPRWRGAAHPGSVIRLPQGPAVATGQGALLLVQVQLEGRRAMPAADFLRGQPAFIGARLG